MPSLNRDGLAKIASDKTGMIEADCLSVLNAAIDAILEHLGAGGRIEIRRLGAFSVRAKAAVNHARNPKTGEPVFIPPHMKPIFKPAEALRQAVMKIPLQQSSVSS